MSRIPNFADVPFEATEVEASAVTGTAWMTPEGIAVTLMMRDGIAPDPN